jgi:RNA polymerase sigma factor (sigma-70 family)
MAMADSTGATLLSDLGFLRRLAWSLTRDDARADDLVQDAAMIALARGQDDVGAPRAWFRRLMANLASNARRSALRRKRHEDLAPQRDAALSPEQHAARREMLEAVVAEVLRLEEPYGSIVMMRFYDGLAPREIAKRIGVADGTARSRLSRGLAILRERLDGRVGPRERWTTLLGPAALLRAGAGAGVKAAVVAAAVLALIVVPVVSMNVFAPASPATPPPQRSGAQASGIESSPPAAATVAADPRDGVARAGEPAREIADGRAAADQDSGATRADPEPAPIRGVVIDSESRQPVPGARISWIEQDLTPPHHPARRSWWDEDAERELIASAHQATSGPDGRFELPGTPGRILAIATHGDRFGIMTSTASGATITLVPDRSDWIEVRDREGRPRSGVPVVARRIGGPGETIVWRGATGADGNAEVRHAQRVRAGNRRVGLEYGIDMPGAKGVEPSAVDGPARVTLEMPPAAALDVRVEAPDRARFAHGARVVVRLIEGTSVSGLEAITDASGSASFPYVAPNADLVVEASDPTGRFKPSAPVEVRSSDAGGSTAVVATFLDRAKSLVLRAVSEDGKPLARRAIVRANAGPPEAGEPDCFASDAEGLVRIPLGGESSVDLIAPTASRVGSVGARVAVPGGVDAGEIDVGRIAFRPLSVLARGRVRNADRTPAAGVNLGGARERRSIEGPPPPWIADPGLLARTGADGGFVLRGLPEGTAIRIRPSRGPASGVRCEEGASDVEIILASRPEAARVSGVRGSIVVDADVPLDLLRASLKRRSEAGSSTSFGPISVPLRGLPAGSNEGRTAEFAFPGIEPGSYDFSLDSVGGGDPVVTTIRTSSSVTSFGSFGGFEGGVAIWEGPRVEIVAGRAADWRLDALDVRHKLRVVKAVVLDRDGKPLAGAEATVLGSGSPARKLGGGISDAEGRVTIVTSLDASRIAARAAGRRTAIARLEGGDPRITLRRGIPVRIVARFGPDAAPAGDLWAQLERTTDPSSRLPMTADEDVAVARLPDDGRVRLVDLAASTLLPAAGHYRLSLLTSSGSRSGAGVMVGNRGIASAVIEVRDADEEQIFEIAPKTAESSERR